MNIEEHVKLNTQGVSELSLECLRSGVQPSRAITGMAALQRRYLASFLPQAKFIRQKHVRIYLLRLQAAKMVVALRALVECAEQGSPEARRIIRLAGMADRRKERRDRARVEP